MKIEDIYTEWTEIDSNIAPGDLGNASLKIPKLHAKYYRMLTNERMRKTKIEIDLEILRNNKRLWIDGTLTKDELAEFGWDVYLKKTNLKSDKDTVVNTDPDVIKKTLELALAREKIDVIESIVKMVFQRSFQISSAINYEKFKNGVM